MNLEQIYNFLAEEEKKRLAPYAMFSNESKGRFNKEKYNHSYRLNFQRDRDKILHSKFFRRLKGKTQVFLSPIGDHYRTRLTHTLEVSQIARTIAKALRLNEDLTEAIALGHDLGHTPFGHMGERALRDLLPNGFHHAKQSQRIAQFMNLSVEVIEGILKHTKGKGAILSDDLIGISLEAQVVRVADIIAYINHDFDDAKRAGFVKEEDIPKSIHKILGDTGNDRLVRMIDAVIFENLNIFEKTKELKRLYIDKNVLNAISDFREFMFEAVYEKADIISDYPKVKRLVQALYFHFKEYPKTFEPLLDRTDDLDKILADYISGMTDNFAIKTYNDIFLPNAWHKDY